MRVNTILPVVAAVASTASAKTITVDVGKDGLVFSPEMITASKGDMLSFHFYPRKHSVVLGTMDKACSPASSGMFYSGMVPISSGEAKETFEVMVNSTDAMYIYCSAAQHCQDGMVAVINGDKDGLDKYKSMAAEASENVSPDAVAGGMIMSGGGGGGSSSMSMTSSGSTSMPSGSSMSSSSAMSSGSSMSSMMSSVSSSSSSSRASGSATSTSGSGGGASSTSGAASSTPSSTDKPAAAPAGFKASVAGVLAAAGGVAAMML